jgi:ferredoxin
VTKLALHRLHERAPSPVDSLLLGEGAPYGTLDVDAAGCSMCFSCVGVCPTGALQGSEDTLRLSFVEDACVQCGLCRATCPEKVIRLAPRLNFTETARNPAVIKLDEPFECVRCGSPFGIRSFIEAIARKLAKAPDGAIERIKMCDRCRVETFHQVDHYV